jgi:hypothetical protein
MQPLKMLDATIFSFWSSPARAAPGPMRAAMMVAA